MRKIDIHEMIERDTAEAAMPTNPTDDVLVRFEKTRPNYWRSTPVLAREFVFELVGALRSARADTRRLREAIENAKRTAGNRWCEWGDRAEAVAMILDAAIAAEEG